MDFDFLNFGNAILLIDSNNLEKIKKELESYYSVMKQSNIFYYCFKNAKLEILELYFKHLENYLLERFFLNRYPNQVKKKKKKKKKN